MILEFYVVEDITAGRSISEVLNRVEIHRQGGNFHGVNCDHSNIHKGNMEGGILTGH